MSLRLSPRQILDAQETEAAFQAKVIALAKLYQWEWIHHNGDSRRSVSGLPDLILARRKPFPRLLFLELKTEKGAARKGKWYGKGTKAHYELGQEEVLEILHAVEGRYTVGCLDNGAFFAGLLRPSDWERIEELLKP